MYQLLLTLDSAAFCPQIAIMYSVFRGAQIRNWDDVLIHWCSHAIKPWKWRRDVTTSRGEWLASNSGRLYHPDWCPRFELALRLGGPQILLALMVFGNTLRSEVRTSSSPHRLSYVPEERIGCDCMLEEKELCHESTSFARYFASFVTFGTSNDRTGWPKGIILDARRMLPCLSFSRFSSFPSVKCRNSTYSGPWQASSFQIPSYSSFLNPTIRRYII
jgi:hypothetical protein